MISEMIYNHAHNRFIPAFILSALELLRKTDLKPTPRTVKFHSFLTGNSIGIYSTEQAAELLSKFPNTYKQFVSQRTDDYYYFLKEILQARFDALLDLSNNCPRSQVIPVSQDIANQLDSILKIDTGNSYPDPVVENLGMLELTLRSYLKNYTRSKGTIYYQKLDEIRSRLLYGQWNYEQARVRRTILSICAMLTMYDNTYAINLFNGDIYKVIVDSRGLKKHPLFNGPKVTNEDIICTGVDYLRLLPFMADDTMTSYTPEAEEYLVNTLVAWPNRIFQAGKEKRNGNS